MLEPRTFQGYWWLPERPDDEVPGTLDFSQQEVVLGLLGTLGEQPTLPTAGGEVTVPMEALMGVEEAPRILGVSRDRKLITLEECNRRSASMGSPGFTEAAYGAKFVLVGKLYKPDEEILFDEIAVRFSNMDAWVATSGFSGAIHTSPDGSTVEGIDISYKPPETITVDLDPTASLQIAFRSTWLGPQIAPTEAKITQVAYFRVYFKQPTTIDRSLTYVASLRNFLSLAVGRPIRVLWVEGCHNADPKAKPDPFTKLMPRKESVEILYRLIGLPEPDEREPQPDEMLFTLGHAQARLEEILGAWSSRQDVLGPVLARYFHYVHTPPSSREHEFESLVRVLETHHRRTTKTAKPGAAHQKRLGEILGALSPENREWLEPRLEYSHEPSLSKRLRQTLARCPQVSKRIVGSSKQRDSFIYKVVLTRNYETHLDPSREDEAATGVELVTLVYQLRALVEMTLLLEIGFTCDEVGVIFDRADTRYRMIEHLRGLT